MIPCCCFTPEWSITAWGMDPDSEQFLSRAMKANPHFHVFYADLASRTLDDIARSRNR